MSVSLEKLGTLLRGLEGVKKPQLSVGLEVGEESLRGVILKKGVMVHAAEWSLPKEEEKRDSILTEAVTALKDKAGANPAPEWFSTVQGSKACLRLIQVPRVPTSELKGAVMWEARNQVPFPLDRSFTDYQTLGEIEGEGGARQLLVMLAAAQQELVQERLDRFQQMGIRLSGLGLPAALIWNGCRHLIEPSDKDAFALVNVDHGKTIVCVGKGMLLEFTREILVSGSYTVSDDAALKGETIRSGEEHPLVRELRRSFDYYQERHKGEKVKHIFLSGGACEENLAELLSSALQVSVEAVDPFRKLGFVEGLAETGRSAAFTVAAAAALASGGINLLPARFRPRKAFPLQKALIPTAALPLLFLGYSYWSLTVSEKEYQKLYQVRQGEITKLQQEEQERAKLKEREKALTGLLAQLPAGSAESLPWEDLFKQVARLLPQNVALKRMTLNSKEGAERAKEPGKGKQPSPGMKVKLEGFIFGGETEVLGGLAGLMEALQRAGRFQAIGISSPLKKNKDFGTPGVDFGLDFEVVMGADSGASKGKGEHENRAAKS
jgi:type IV pilus assembly protein PilM